MDSLTEQLKKMTPLQRAVFALKETQARLEALQQKQSEPIAIVGMACRFPGGASDATTFWRLLREGVDAIGEIPPDRWNVDEFFDPDPAAPGKMNSRWGGFLERIDEFDNHFFSISDTEASRIDPQQRLLLELAWEALEDAGLPPSGLRGAKMGVFVGISTSEYAMVASGDLAQTGAHAATGTALCLAANRISFVLGLQGPSMALDTACSSSLVAIHLACQSIRNGECEGALVGGASILLSPFGTVNLTKAGLSSPDGRVHAFDAAAAGYVRSEGAGLIVLKPLAAALKHGDPVHAVIRGSAVNQNGVSNGLTAPSRVAQEQVLREAYARAQVPPGQVYFVETQGTGTRLGDTMEALALGSVLGQGRAPGSSCSLGALKTNIGHLEAASGIASVIKAALALRHRQIPPNLHFRVPNPDIPFDTLPIKAQRELEPWPEAAHPRFAGVNAFGFGGSNAHVVLEEPQASLKEPAGKDAAGSQLLPLSARTEKALHALAHRYLEFLGSAPPAWPDVCHTAAARRDHHDCRLAVLAESHEQAIGRLRSFVDGRSAPGVFSGRKPFGRALKLAFLFSDRPEVWEPFVRWFGQAPGLAEAAKDIDTVCQRVAGCSPRTLEAGDPRWHDPAWSKLLLLVLQLALTAWWRRAGIIPDVLLGQGVGELAAASAAGILTIEEALRLAVGHCNPDEQSRGNPRPRAASLPFLSAVDGLPHPGTDLTADHWRSCLEFSRDLAVAAPALADRQLDLCLEMGPASLAESARQVIAQGCSASFLLPSLCLAENCRADVLRSVGVLYAAGADPHWEHFAPANARCVRVPAYPWQRQRLWAARARREAQFSGLSLSGGDGSQANEPRGYALPSAKIRPRPDLAAPYVAPRTKLEADMVQSWAKLLQIEGIGIHDNFFELGGDSLQATILLNRLEEQLGEAIPGHVLFRIQTINDLADYVRKQCAVAVRRRYPGEPTPSGETSPPAASVAGGVPGPASGEPVGIVSFGSIPHLPRDQRPEELLARLDELSDDEVKALLEQAAADGEVGDE